MAKRTKNKTRNKKPIVTQKSNVAIDEFGQFKRKPVITPEPVQTKGSVRGYFLEAFLILFRIVFSYFKELFTFEERLNILVVFGRIFSDLVMYFISFVKLRNTIDIIRLALFSFFVVTTFESAKEYDFSVMHWLVPLVFWILTDLSLYAIRYEPIFVFFVFILMVMIIIWNLMLFYPWNNGSVIGLNTFERSHKVRIIDYHCRG